MLIWQRGSICASRKMKKKSDKIAKSQSFPGKHGPPSEESSTKMPPKKIFHRDGADLKIGFDALVGGLSHALPTAPAPQNKHTCHIV